MARILVVPSENVNPAFKYWRLRILDHLLLRCVYGAGQVNREPQCG